MSCQGNMVEAAGWHVMPCHRPGQHDGGGGPRDPSGTHFGSNWEPPRLVLGATGSTKDHFGGNLGASDFSRNPQIMQIWSWDFLLSGISRNVHCK